MKVVILAGGLGSRISEESFVKPKPLIEIGGKPIIWHIMKLYSNYGLNDFIICCGYKGYLIKEYFVNYYMFVFELGIRLIGLQTNHNYTILHHYYKLFLFGHMLLNQLHMLDIKP